MMPPNAFARGPAGCCAEESPYARPVRDGYQIQCEACGSWHTREHSRKHAAWADYLEQVRAR